MRNLKQLIPRFCLICEQQTGSSLALCLSCRRKINFTQNPIQSNPPQFTPFTYTGLVRDFLLQLKFHKKLICADILAQLVAETCPTPIEANAIVPIPLHKKRQRQRGYNQVLELARPLSKILNIRIDNALLTRQKHTLPQTELTAAQRRQNLHQAFHANPLAEPKKLILLDDVITTGSTLKEAYHCLAERHEVHIWTVATAR